jgi:biotin operon repressor
MQDVLQILLDHKDTPVSRKMLAELTHKGDRAIRQAISDLRRDGAFIINGKAGGYVLTADEAEFETFREKERRAGIARMIPAPRDFYMERFQQVI